MEYGYEWFIALEFNTPSATRGVRKRCRLAY